MCHFGLVQRINAMDFTQIVIFGGWTLDGTKRAYLFREDDLSPSFSMRNYKQTDKHSMLEITRPVYYYDESLLPLQDFFFSSGSTISV